MTTATTTTETQFTDKKSVFFSKYEGIFATPKKLNRSHKAIPSEFIDKIENKECNSADIEALQSFVPIFVYKTCLTIHGQFPHIHTTRIGGYKNIIQNQNGSLEIRWSAIDVKAKRQIADYLKCDSLFYTIQDSANGIYFEKCKTTSDKAEAIEILAEFKKEAQEIKIPGMVAKYFVAGYSAHGKYYIFMTVLPFKITGNTLTIAALLTKQSEEKIFNEYSAKKAEQDQREQELKKKMEDIENRKANAMKQAEDGIKHLRPCKIIPEVGSVYFIPTVSKDWRPCYRVIKIMSKGSFGRVTVGTYLTGIPQVDESRLEPMLKGRQMKIDEITTKQVYA